MTYPCRWPGCTHGSDFFALDDRARYGHLCMPHWYGFLDLEEQKLYVHTLLRSSDHTV